MPPKGSSANPSIHVLVQTVPARTRRAKSRQVEPSRLQTPADNP